MSRIAKRMYEIGVKRFWNLIEEHGGVYTFDTTPMNEERLNDLIDNNEIIYFKDREEILIPKFQFDKADNFYNGISLVIKRQDWNMHGVTRFLLCNMDYGDIFCKPIDLIKIGDVYTVCRMADDYFEQRP